MTGWLPLLCGLGMALVGAALLVPMVLADCVRQRRRRRREAQQLAQRTDPTKFTTVEWQHLHRVMAEDKAAAARIAHRMGRS